MWATILSLLRGLETVREGAQVTSLFPGLGGSFVGTWLGLMPCVSAIMLVTLGALGCKWRSGALPISDVPYLTDPEQAYVAIDIASTVNDAGNVQLYATNDKYEEKRNVLLRAAAHIAEHKKQLKGLQEFALSMSYSKYSVVDLTFNKYSPSLDLYSTGASPKRSDVEGQSSPTRSCPNVLTERLVTTGPTALSEARSCLEKSSEKLSNQYSGPPSIVPSQPVSKFATLLQLNSATIPSNLAEKTPTEVDGAVSHPPSDSSPVGAAAPSYDLLGIDMDLLVAQSFGPHSDSLPEGVRSTIEQCTLWSSHENAVPVNSIIPQYPLEGLKPFPGEAASSAFRAVEEHNMEILPNEGKLNCLASGSLGFDPIPKEVREALNSSISTGKGLCQAEAGSIWAPRVPPGFETIPQGITDIFKTAEQPGSTLPERDHSPLSWQLGLADVPQLPAQRGCCSAPPTQASTGVAPGRKPERESCFSTTGLDQTATFFRSSPRVPVLQDYWPQRVPASEHAEPFASNLLEQKSSNLGQGGTLYSAGIVGDADIAQHTQQKGDCDPAPLAPRVTVTPMMASLTLESGSRDALVQWQFPRLFPSLVVPDPLPQLDFNQCRFNPTTPLTVPRDVRCSAVVTSPGQEAQTTMHVGLDSNSQHPQTLAKRGRGSPSGKAPDKSGQGENGPGLLWKARSWVAPQQGRLPARGRCRMAYYDEEYDRLHPRQKHYFGQSDSEACASPLPEPETLPVIELENPPDLETVANARGMVCMVRPEESTTKYLRAQLVEVSLKNADPAPSEVRQSTFGWMQRHVVRMFRK